MPPKKLDFVVAELRGAEHRVPSGLSAASAPSGLGSLGSMGSNIAQKRLKKHNL